MLQNVYRFLAGLNDPGTVVWDLQYTSLNISAWGGLVKLPVYYFILRLTGNKYVNAAGCVPVPGWSKRPRHGSVGPAVHQPQYVGVGRTDVTPSLSVALY